MITTRSSCCGILQKRGAHFGFDSRIQTVYSVLSEDSSGENDSFEGGGSIKHSRLDLELLEPDQEAPHQSMERVKAILLTG